jgi:AcrR family transcriptional regulator
MSKKPPDSTRKTDRRVQRTRDALGDALITLMREKPFNAITVQEVLDLAGVSRSTFYTHFHDKDDLFLSNADDSFHHMANLLALRDEASQRVAPVRELLAHAASLGEFHAALVASGKHQDAMELAREHFGAGACERFRGPGGSCLHVDRSDVFTGVLVAGQWQTGIARADG